MKYSMHLQKYGKSNWTAEITNSQEIHRLRTTQEHWKLLNIEVLRSWMSITFLNDQNDDSNDGFTGFSSANNCLQMNYHVMWQNMDSEINGYIQDLNFRVMNRFQMVNRRRYFRVFFRNWLPEAQREDAPQQSTPRSKTTSISRASVRHECRSQMTFNERLKYVE